MIWLLAIIATTAFVLGYGFRMWMEPERYPLYDEPAASLPPKPFGDMSKPVGPTAPVARTRKMKAKKAVRR